MTTTKTAVAADDGEPYEVDPDDRLAIGRLQRAAQRGDQRARLTLEKLSTKTDEPNAADEIRGILSRLLGTDDTDGEKKSKTKAAKGVKAGRSMFAGRGRRSAYDDPDAA